MALVMTTRATTTVARATSGKVRHIRGGKRGRKEPGEGPRRGGCEA